LIFLVNKRKSVMVDIITKHTNYTSVKTYVEMITIDKDGYLGLDLVQAQNVAVLHRLMKSQSSSFCSFVFGRCILTINKDIVIQRLHSILKYFRCFFKMFFNYEIIRLEMFSFINENITDVMFIFYFTASNSPLVSSFFS